MQDGKATFFKEIGEFYRFFKTNKSERDIVFYAETAGDYSFFEGIITDLVKKYGMKICYVTSDRNDPMLSGSNPKIKTFYINHMLGFFTLLLDSKMLIMTMPDLNLFHIKRSIRGTNHVYLFHNIGSSFHVIRYGALFHYDTILCVGPHHIEEIRKQEELYKLPKKELVKFGYYRLDKVHLQYRAHKHEKEYEKCKAKILIAPGWGKWEKRDSLLDVCGSRLIRNLLEANYEVVLRPHPMTRKKYPEFLDSLYNEFKSYENFKHEENIASMETFFSSDVMISDWSGVVYEYAFGTEKPVLFIDVPIKINNQNYKDLGIEPVDIKLRGRIGMVFDLQNIGNVDSAVDELIKNRDKHKDEIIKARSEFVYNFGNSSEAGAKYIYNFCKDNKDA